ncbi:hypothetical protein CVT26_003095 [Gymnopilus dilepis]|uniref:Uncharacterized protein n=1 Tax=Gymnopilus dilepis TaxID=231916 RepID=A0A409Y4V8_9AGAR|nr:hypothetical protein CVT26_003095 [Gymnopilus dilepis]
MGVQGHPFNLIPQCAPFDFEFKKKRDNVKLHTCRLFLENDCETRSIQKIVNVIRKNLAKNSLGLTCYIAKDEDGFREFYEAFSKIVEPEDREDMNHVYYLSVGSLDEFQHFRCSCQSPPCPSVLETQELYIRIIPDKENKILFIRDNGIGMTNGFMAALSSGAYIFMVDQLGEDQFEYLEEKKVQEVVKKHSEFISYLIQLTVGDEAEEGEEGDRRKIEEVDRKEETVVNEKLNMAKPFWTRNPSDVTQEEYAAFCQSLTDVWEDHLAVERFLVEGDLDFKAVLSIPERTFHRAPFDLFQRKKKHNNIKLYVRRVFIMDDCEGLIRSNSTSSGYRRLRGSPSQLSHETLQRNKALKIIPRTLSRRPLTSSARLLRAGQLRQVLRGLEAEHQARC